MPTEAPTWEETTEIEPLWEETTPFEEPVALEPPDIVVQPQTGVVQSAAPGSIAPTDLKPSVRLIGGEQVTGNIGDTHPDIIKRESIPAVDIDQRGFQGPGGEFFPRESAAIATGLPTEMEPTRLHSTDLAKAEAEAKPPTFQAPLEITPWKPLYTPEEVKAYHEAEKYGGIFPEGMTPEQKIRRSSITEGFFGPSPEELEAMGGAAGSRQGVVPVMSAVMPILPVGIGGTTGKALMGYFTADFIAQQPEIYAQAKEAYDRGDMDTVRRIVTEDVLAGGMMAVGAKETFAPSGGRGIPIQETVRPAEVPVPKTEVAPTEGFKATPIPESEIWGFLGKEHGVKKGGFVEVVPEFEPGKENDVAELRWRRTTDESGNEVLEPTGIRVNQSKVYNKNVLKEFVDHELGHYVDLKKPEVIGQVLDQMPIEERLSIDKQIERLKYPTEEKAYEFNARAIHQMAKAWRGRPWFERIVLNVKSFLGETIGLKASDKVLRARAEKVAVRALSWASRRIKESAAPKAVEPAAAFAARAEKLEPEKPGMVRLYSGSEGEGIRSSWFTERPERASSFGKYISYIDVPKSVADSARQQIKTDYVLPDKWANKAITVPEPVPQRTFDVGTFAGHVQEGGDPGITTKELVKMTPDELVAWKKRVLYGPRTYQMLRESMKPEDAEALKSERDRLRSETKSILDKVEGGTLQERLDAATKAGPIYTKSATLNEVLEAQPKEAGAFAAKAPPLTAPIGEAAEQLTERLKATPPVGTREKLSLRETIADAWAQGKAIFDRSRARAQAVTETIKDAAKGAREPSELDKRVGELDWLLQRAVGQSRDMGKTMRKQVRDANLRRAAAIWIDTPGDAATKTSTIRTALSDLQLNPELWRKTPNEVKRAMETAANMPSEGVQFAESLREYYARRNQDAVDHSLFEHGLEDYFTHVWGNEKNMPDDLRGAIGGGRVQTYWQFSRQRKLGTFLDGIMRGKIPQLDPANVLPFYNYTLDRAIASRSFIKNITDNMVASDGRAVVAPTGTLSRVPQGQPTEASLVRPKGKTGEIADYKTINHPALRKWKWMANDENGKPILSQNDLVVHPEHYERLARMMDMSRLKGSRVSEALLRASTEVKGFKLGLLSAFHQVHVGSHALFHWTLPFNFKDPRFFTPEGDIKWNSPDVRFAIEKGHLKIAPDARELKIFAEGLLSPGLIHKIPVVGPWSRAYSEWTFGEYIPKLKLKTFSAAMPRNLRWYRGKLSEDAIAARVGDAVNNAYGELNNLFLGKIGRNPGTQRMLRGIFLAPDFGEARLRFVGKGLTSYGTEERLALATMFITLYTAARVGNWLSHGDPELDPKRAFQVKSGKHWWSMRSVIGDLDRAFLDTSRFFYVRLNPLYSRTAADWLFGRDINGRKLSPMEKIVKRPLNQLVPIQFQALTRDDQALWESLIGAMGLGAVSDTPQQDVYQLVDKWMKNSDDPKLQAAFKRREAEVFPPSDYMKLRYALRHDDEEGARKAYEELLKTRKPATITDAMLPGKPFTGSFPNELKFRNSLTDAQRKVYDQARQEQKEMYSKFQIIRRSPEPAEKEPTWEETVPVTE